MILRRCYLTKNACYKLGKKHTVRGIMVHSTGSNNPRLSRYVQPDDGALGKNQNENSWNTDKPGGRSVCVHAFIGQLADDTVATYQTLPWEIVGWHSASGKNGSANNMGYIGFEICEDGLTDNAYFQKVYREAAELCAHLCKIYGLDPMKDGVIISHAEGHERGIASNHGDPDYWFAKHGKSMDTLRAAVEEILSSTNVKEEEDMIVYETMNEIPAWAKPTVNKLMAKNLLKGEDGKLNLEYNMLRVLVINDRAGLYGK